MRKLIYLAATLALVALVAWQAWRRMGEEEGPGRRGGPPEVAVEVGQLRRGQVRDMGRFTGSLVANYEFTVAPRIPGRLKSLMVDVGDRVERGQLIALMDDEEYARQAEQSRAQLEVARAQLKEAESSLENALREYERARSLHERGITSEAELEVREVAYRVAVAKRDVARASVTQSEAALKAAEVRLAYTRVGAEWDAGGDRRFVGERFVDEGTMLRANDPICTVLEIDTLKAIVHIIEADYARLRIGQRAEIETDAWPGRTFAGRVSRIAPELRAASRKARVEIQVENADLDLKPGMFVRASVEYDRREDAVLAPAAALVRRNGEPGVFLVDHEEMQARFVAVQTGASWRGETEIVSPDLEGWVVTLGHHLLGEEGRITLPGESGAGAPQGGARVPPAQEEASRRLAPQGVGQGGQGR